MAETNFCEIIRGVIAISCTIVLYVIILWNLKEPMEETIKWLKQTFAK